MMGLDTAETCRDWQNILRISCASSWFFLTRIWYDMVLYDDMIWYDMIWYDMIWYDMIWYDTYLLTEIG
jgi:hypothetical protein